MIDCYQRKIDYLRISITDRCNLRCQYCMPASGLKMTKMEEILTYEEILMIVKKAVKLGICYIKITGGEPLVRLGCVDLIKQIKQVKGIKKVTLTTNGVLLKQYLPDLIAAGIDGINVSLDTLDQSDYALITRRNCFKQVNESIQAVLKTNIPLKINVVSLKMLENSYQDLFQLAKNYPVAIRFIELMPIGLGKQFAGINHQELLNQIKQQYPTIQLDKRKHGQGPAIYYQIPDFKGSIGFISAIHGKFCGSCNRLRLTAQGFLKPCLCYDDGIDLKEMLRNNQDILPVMKAVIYHKPQAHCFEDETKITELKGMSMIGG